MTACRPIRSRTAQRQGQDEAAVLVVDHLAKTYGGPGVPVAGASTAAAVDDVSLSVREGELLTLLGPSGCGKTTTLRSIAGLETPNAGRISLRGTALFDAAEDAMRKAKELEAGA